MQIQCPSCAAVYDIPDQLVKRGPRALRCAACGKTWSLSAEPEAPAARGDAAEPRDFRALVSAVAGSSATPTEPAMAAQAPPAPEAGTAPPSKAEAEEELEAGVEARETPEQQQLKAAAAAASVTAAIAAQSSSARPSIGLLVAWLATLGGLGSLLMAFLFYPQGVVARWPAAARLYEAVGIAVGAS